MLETPLEFKNQMQSILGDQYLEFAKSLESRPKTTIRLNLSKTKKLESISNIKSVQNIPWCKNALSFESRPEFVLDPLYHAGCNYPQESSSIFICQYLMNLDQTKPLKVLDLCAAPGGKSGLLLDYLPPNSLLVSNEIDNLRAKVLADNMIRQGSCFVVVTNNEAKDFGHLLGYFDLILIDAPCSGEGMMAKEEVAIKQWTPKLVSDCANLQKQIVDEIWPCLVDGGKLIYSTCTYNKQEDEEIVSHILDTGEAAIIELEGTFAGVVSKVKGQYHFYPHLTLGLGFFCAGFVKDNKGQDTFEFKKHKGKDPLYFRPQLPDEGYLLNSVDFDTVARDNMLYCIPKLWKTEIVDLLNCFKVIKFGVEVGRWKGPDWFPSHDLALCSAYIQDVSTVELTYEQAIVYLRKEQIDMELEQQSGWLLVTYQGHRLGWVKSIQHKPKNYLPTSWRIRQQ